MAEIGTVIDGKYEILTLVGQGGMSKVYLAMDKRLNKQWAVKEIEKRARDKNNAIVVQSAIAEANLIKRLDHKTLPRIVDILDNGNVIYIIMDYIEGESLNKVLDRDGAQSQEQVIEWAKDLCEVLDYLHMQDPPIIYRDMKPANIMLKPDGTLKLIDFGIAREFKDQNVEDTVWLGTKGYAAPEQFGGKGQTDARTDIYCLGVTLHHLVTGHDPCEPPYEISPIRRYDPSLSAGFEAVIQKCTQLNPLDRYQSCAELMYALENYEVADQEYRAMQMAKLKKFIISASVTLACVIIGCLFLLLNANDNNSNYAYYISQANSSSEFYVDIKYEPDDVDDTNTAAKINQYFAAIDCKPTNLERYDENTDNPYFEVINACKDRLHYAGDDDVREETSKAMEELCAKVQNNLNSNTSRYAELSYNIAIYYLYSSRIEDYKAFSSAKGWIDNAANSTSNSENDERYRSVSRALQTIIEFENTISDEMVHQDLDKDKKSFEDSLDNMRKVINDVTYNGSKDEQYDVYYLTLLVLGNNDVIEYLKGNKGYSQREIKEIVGSFDEVANGQIDTKKKTLTDTYKSFEKVLTDVYGGVE